MKFRRRRRAMPEVARFGFDHGWLFLGPRFLNLGLPVLLVDHRLLGYRPAQLGLEPLGTRNPRLPLPQTRTVAEVHPGDLVALWQAAGDRPRELLASHRAAVAGTVTAAAEGSAVLIVGDSYQIELGWASLFDGHIGIARLIDTVQSHTRPVEVDSGRHRRRGTARAA